MTFATIRVEQPGLVERSNAYDARPAGRAPVHHTAPERRNHPDSCEGKHSGSSTRYPRRTLRAPGARLVLGE
ncbi:MAG: hypothetical protein EOO70_01100 [Myxococcaceae bacterium]|nr:MAG: hypothetical protein EOO70_01100 [Myxococcaceae bacterium]